jgi:hypothetical protein
MSIDLTIRIVLLYLRQKQVLINAGLAAPLKAGHAEYGICK